MPDEGEDIRRELALMGDLSRAKTQPPHTNVQKMV